MRIAFVYDLVYPYSKGGVEKRIWDLAHLLIARGHEVDVLCTRAWAGSSDLIVDGIRFRGIADPVEIHTSGGRRSIDQGIKFAVSAGSALAKSRYDIVELQAMTPLTCLVALAACRIRKSVPVVTWYEVWREYWNEYLGPIGYLGRLVELLVARLSRSNAAASRLAETRLRELGGSHVSLIPIGIPFGAIDSVKPAVDETDVLYVGRLMRHKNLELLIDALSLLEARGVEPRLSIIGEGPNRETLMRRAAEKGLENVDFLGRVESDEQIHSIMKSARIFAFPSKREGFGLAPLEAAACALPVVTADEPLNAATELIEDGKNGLVVAPTPNAFADAIEELLVDETHRKRMGAEARARAELFDWPEIADRTEQFFEDCLLGRARAVSQVKADDAQPSGRGRLLRK